MIRKLSSIDGMAAPAVAAKNDKQKSSSNTDQQRVGMLGIIDPNFFGFLTPALANLLPTLFSAGNSYYGGLSVVDPSNFGSSGIPMFPPTTTGIFSKSGDGASSIPYLQPGAPTIGSFSTSIKKIQRRYKDVYNTSNPDVYFSWKVRAVEVSPDYVVQPDERLDGGYHPGSFRNKDRYDLYFTDPTRADPKHSPVLFYNANLYGNSFPVGPHGGFLYSPNMLDDDAWSGEVTESLIEDGADISIISIGPTEITAGQSELLVVTFSFADFTGGTFSASGLFFDVHFPLISMYIGPYQVSEYLDQSYGIAEVVGQQMTVIGVISIPKGAKPGLYDFFMISPKGRMVTLKNAFEVMAIDPGTTDWDSVTP